MLQESPFQSVRRCRRFERHFQIQPSQTPEQGLKGIQTLPYSIRVLLEAAISQL